MIHVQINQFGNFFRSKTDDDGKTAQYEGYEHEPEYRCKTDIHFWPQDFCPLFLKESGKIWKKGPEEEVDDNKAWENDDPRLQGTGICKQIPENLKEGPT